MPRGNPAARGTPGERPAKGRVDYTSQHSQCRGFVTADLRENLEVPSIEGPDPAHTRLSVVAIVGIPEQRDRRIRLNVTDQFGGT